MIRTYRITKSATETTADTHQYAESFLRYSTVAMATPVTTEKINAVLKANLPGLKIFKTVRNRNKVQNKFKGNIRIPYKSRSGIEFIPYAFYCFDGIITEFLADLADVHIDGTVAHNDVIAPDPCHDFVSGKNLTGP